ncbi:MAG: transporter substrate-binding domain-containing protein [Nitrospinae bacterium]|nr:transporter substrate-binding domain-containing protein [Nitrospinota bacterium]
MYDMDEGDEAEPREKPSEVFRRYFGPEHGVELPPRAPKFFAACVSVVFFALAATACAAPSGACTSDGRVLKFGFYAFFKPLSYSADANPESAGFHVHQGYEADLLNALEAMKGAGLAFSRRGIGTWKNIWLRAAGPQYDMVGGGITILASRTLDAAGGKAVVFTSGHVAFRQSLLVRAGDAGRIRGHGDLGGARVGVLAGTTGEARLLALTDLANSAGVLAAGARVRTPRGEALADGSAAYAIRASGASPLLAGRTSIEPPSADMPRVVYLGAKLGETEFLAALREGRVDAVARGEIGNRDAAHASGGAFAVTALDPEAEYGGFALAARDAALAACISRKLEWLTDGRRIGYRQWRADPSVFMRRARMWRMKPGR